MGDFIRTLVRQNGRIAILDCQRQPAGRAPWTVRVNPDRGLQMMPYNSHHLGTMFHSRFLISNPDPDWFAPGLVSLVDLPTCRWRGGKGAKGPAPLTPGSGLCRLPGKLRVTGCSPSAGSHTPSMRDAPSYGHPDRAPISFPPPR